MEQKIAGVYETQTETSAIALTDRVARVMGISMPEYPPNDPLQNSAEQVDGKGQNAYSFNSSYLPKTNGIGSYKGALKMSGCDSGADYAKTLADMVEYAYDIYGKAPPAYKWGTICTMTEKFGWKAGLIEDSVESKLLEIDGVEAVEEELEDVPSNEKAGKDIVLNIDGKETSVQVKTNTRSTQTKGAEYLAKVKASLDEEKIEFEVIKA